MEAVVLAGGLGTRLQKVVSDVPKPMAPVNGRPFLEYILEDLKNKGIRKVILAVGYKKEVIKNHFKNEYKGMKIEYSEENSPLGTGGAIKQALNYCEAEDIFIINGDTFFDVDFIEMKKKHEKNYNDLTIAIKEMENIDRYGTIVTKNEEIVKFEEKKYKEKGWINGGIYLLKRKLLKNNKNISFSFEKEILENKKLVLRKGIFRSQGYFIDIGIPEDYYKFKNYKNGIIIYDKN